MESKVLAEKNASNVSESYVIDLYACLVSLAAGSDEPMHVCVVGCACK